MIVPILLALAITIAAAKVGGWISGRLGQPSVLGELVVGLLLGPSVMDLFGGSYFEASHTSETLHELGELGVIFLMFTAGLEMHLSDLRQTGRSALFVGVAGVIVPILLGAAVMLFFGYDTTQAVFTGIILSATSVSISAQTLIELNQLRSREGLTLLGAAVVDDVLAIAVLSAFVAVAVEGEAELGGIIWIIVKMLLFIVAAMLLALWLLPRIARWIERLPVSESLLSLVVVSTLFFAWASEAIGGVAAITGAFIVGVALSGSPLKKKIGTGIHVLAYAFFVPIFLVSIGLTADLRELSGSDLGLAITISLVAILSKLIGAGGGAKLGGMTWNEALRVGLGMISRGEVGLIVAGVGISSKIIAANVFTIAVVIVLVTTLVTPPLLRLAFRSQEATNA